MQRLAVVFGCASAMLGIIAAPAGTSASAENVVGQGWTEASAVDSNSWDAGTPEQVAWEYLLENKDRLGMQENLADLQFIRTRKVLSTHHVSFQQVYDGLRVWGARLVISINKTNRVSSVSIDYKPGISVDSTPALSAPEAVLVAGASLGLGERAFSHSAEELVIYESSDRRFHLAWKATIDMLESIGSWDVMVDAHNGEVLYIWDNLIGQEISCVALVTWGRVKDGVLRL